MEESLKKISEVHGESIVNAFIARLAFAGDDAKIADISSTLILRMIMTESILSVMFRKIRRFSPIHGNDVIRLLVSNHIQEF